MALKDLEAAKRRLRITHAFEDTAIEEALDMMEAVMFDALKREKVAEDENDLVLKSGLMMLLSHFWDNRGSEDTTISIVNGNLPRNVLMFLNRKRRLTLA